MDFNQCSTTMHRYDTSVTKPSTHDIIDYIPVLQTGSFFVHLGMMFDNIRQLNKGKELAPERVKDLTQSRNHHAFRLLTILPIIGGIILGIFDYFKFKKSKAELKQDSPFESPKPVRHAPSRPFRPANSCPARITKEDLKSSARQEISDVLDQVEFMFQFGSLQQNSSKKQDNSKIISTLNSILQTIRNEQLGKDLETRTLALKQQILESEKAVSNEKFEDIDFEDIDNVESNIALSEAKKSEEIKSLIPSQKVALDTVEKTLKIVENFLNSASDSNQPDEPKSLLQLLEKSSQILKEYKLPADLNDKINDLKRQLLAKQSQTSARTRNLPQPSSSQTLSGKATGVKGKVARMVAAAEELKQQSGSLNNQ